MGISFMPMAPSVLKAPTPGQVAPGTTMPSAPLPPTTALPKPPSSLTTTLNTVKSMAAANPSASNPVTNFLNSFSPSVAKAAGLTPPPAPTPANTAAPSRLMPGSITNPVPGATTPAPSSGATMPGASPAPGPGPNANAGPLTPSSVATGNTVLPTTDPRLASTEGQVNTAAGNLANVDRTKLAEQMFNTFQQSSNPAYEASLRDANRAAAGAGRIGSGMLRTSLGDLAAQRTNQLQTAQQQFMQDALEGSIQDQFNKVNALSGLEGQQYGESADTNNQLRTERGYQTGLGQQAFQDAMAQHQQQQADQAQKFSQGVTATALSNGSNPATIIGSLASQGVDPSVAAMLAQSLAQRQTNTGVKVPTPPGYIYNGGSAVPNNVG